jgi:putative ABC transport system permease protein
MIRNYLKIALRNLWKNKTFSLINILGLALGMACSLLIMLWVKSEIGMDKFHKNDDRLYRVMENQRGTDVIKTTNSTPGILAESIIKDIPEIEMASQMLAEQNTLFTVENTFDKERGRFVQVDFLQMFSFELENGNAKTALKSFDGVVISKKLAEKYFKGQDPIGKAIKIDNAESVIVTGVLKEIPKESSLKFDFLMNYDSWLKKNKWAADWGNHGPKCYVLLAKNASIDKVNAKIKNYIKTKKTDSIVELFLQNYGDSYLYSKWSSGFQDGGRIEYVKIFSWVSIFILVIGCINFMNLATARSVKRAKEVGIRKAIGAAKSALIRQFIGESILIAFLALIFAILIVVLLLPAFNNLTEKQLSFDFTNPQFLLVLFGLTLVTGLISGSYPAFFMSSLNPIVVLKGALKFKPSATFFRKGLVIFQFTLSIVLILGMIVIERQIDYIQSKNLGFDRENLLSMPLESDLAKSRNFITFKQELVNQIGIKAVTSSESGPIEVGSSTFGVSWAGKDTTKIIQFSQNAVSYDYLKTMGIQLVGGRDFSTDFGMDSTNYLINEAAAKVIGYKNPNDAIGKEISRRQKKGIIIGVMKDFHHASLQVAIEPLILHLQRDNKYYGDIIVRIEAGRTKQAMANLEKTYRKFNPGTPFKYTFADDEFAQSYKSESTVSKLSNFFAFLAIFISCLGLFGLASFMAEQRTKEIGIRKVLGANVASIVAMLSKDFIVLVLISAVIAFPTASYFMKNWLEKYANRIEISWWIFVVSGVLAVLIALLTVIYQAIKAALMDPVKSLKTE